MIILSSSLVPWTGGPFLEIGISRNSNPKHPSKIARPKGMTTIHEGNVWSQGPLQANMAKIDARSARMPKLLQKKTII